MKQISNNCKEFAVTVRSLRDHFTNLIKRDKLKTRLEIKKTGLGGEELSEKNQLLDDIMERFEESKRRTKVDTQKGETISKTKKKESSRNEKKPMERFGETKKREVQDER